MRLRALWHRHYRPIVLTLALITVLIWVLALTQPHEFVEGVWTVRLRSCYLDHHTPIHAVALACPGVDYIKLWPLPVEGPWQQTPDPLPGWLPGGYARR